MKRRPCWCPKPVIWELNCFLMPTLSFVPMNLHRCWPRGWKRSVRHFHISHNAPYLPPPPPHPSPNLKTMPMKSFSGCKWGYYGKCGSGVWKDCTSCSYNPGQKSRTVLQYSYFSLISRFPLKTVHPFRHFLQFFLSLPIQSWNSEIILDTRVQNCLLGEGRGWTCVNWKTPQKCKSVPRLFVHVWRSLIVFSGSGIFHVWRSGFGINNM